MLRSFSGMSAVMLAMGLGAPLAQGQEAGRFSVALDVAHIDAHGMRDFGSFDRRMDQIEHGDEAGLSVRGWVESWAYWDLAYSRSRLVYGNPQGSGCPVDAFAILFPNRVFCQPIAQPRRGTIHDDVDTLRASVGVRKQEWLGRFGAYAQVGYGYSSWRSSEDREANLVVECLGGDPSFVPVEDCSRVSDRSSDHGWTGAAGGILTLGRRVTLSAGWRYEALTYRPFRNSVLEDFVETNCTRDDNCLLERYVAEERSSWDWWEARLSIDVNRNWSAEVSYEAGGRRNWNVAGVAIRYAWN